MLACSARGTLRGLAMAILFAALSCMSATPAWASSFSIADALYQVHGELFTFDAAGGTQTVQSYDQSSNAPLFEQILDVYGLGTASVATSVAAGSYLSVDVDGRDPLALAYASEVVDFVPHFDGSIDGILFYGMAPFTAAFGPPSASWTIVDLTTGALVTDGVGDRNGFSDPLSYDDWNSTHTYQLTMEVNASVNAGDTPGWMATNLFSVPEPPAIELMGLGLAMLVAFESRRRKHQTLAAMSTLKAFR